VNLKHTLSLLYSPDQNYKTTYLRAIICSLSITIDVWEKKSWCDWIHSSMLYSDMGSDFLKSICNNPLWPQYHRPTHCQYFRTSTFALSIIHVSSLLTSILMCALIKSFPPVLSVMCVLLLYRSHVLLFSSCAPIISFSCAPIISFSRVLSPTDIIYSTRVYKGLGECSSVWFP